jgi:transposase
MPHPVAEPLRPFTQEEQKGLQRVKRATSEPLLRHQRAVALLAVAEGQSRTQASRQAGWQGYETVSKLVRRFNEQGLTALDDHPRSGRPATYGAEERGRILQEARRTPDRDKDATATWSLSLLQRALRQAPDGLPEVSTFTILHTLHEAGYTWQKSRTWCKTGITLRKNKEGVVEQSEDPYTQEKKR